MQRNKVIMADEAMSLIQDGWTIGIEGFVGAGTPDDLCVALSERYLKKDRPNQLTLIHSSGPGDAGTAVSTASPTKGCTSA